MAEKLNRMQELLLKTRMKLELEKRKMQEEFRHDFPAYAKENLSIKPKDVTKGYIPFVMNQAQEYAHKLIEEQREKTGKVRAIILKSRQQGFSTMVSARNYWRTTSNPLYQSVVITNRADTTQLLFDMTRRFHELQPEDYRPKIKSSNKSGMSFDGIDSSYHVYTAGSSQVGRGTTPTILHASEVAFWPNADDLLAGLFQGIPNTDGTEIVLESTANGASGFFYELWNAAQEKDSEWLPIFIPWFWTDEYESQVPSDFELSHEEEDYKKEFELTDSQMQWRREKTAGGKFEVFKQEYPATAREAFLSSGSVVFPTEIVNDWDPIKPMVMESFSAAPRLNFDLDPRGKLSTWGYKDNDTGYIVGADVSNGVGGDYSTAVVMDQNYKLVAIYRDNVINPGAFGELLYHLGQRYNNALIICESNGPGSATLNQLMGMDYPNMYYETKLTQGSTDETMRLGFTTTGKSKPHIISGLSHSIRQKQFISPCHIMRHEIMSYEIDKNGKMGAPIGLHDDTVIAAALCIEGLRTHSATLHKKVNWMKYSQYTENNTKWL